MDPTDKMRDAIRQFANRQSGVAPGGREEVIFNAACAILKDRRKAYGTTEDNFGTIAGLWNVYAKAGGRPIGLTAHDIGMLMDFVKTSRIASSPEVLDHYIDKAGYSGCTADLIITLPAPPPDQVADEVAIIETTVFQP